LHILNEIFSYKKCKNFISSRLIVKAGMFTFDKRKIVIKSKSGKDGNIKYFLDVCLPTVCICETIKNDIILKGKAQ